MKFRKVGRPKLREAFSMVLSLIIQSYDTVNVKSKLSLDYVKTNPEKLEIFLVQNFKKLRQGFLSEMLRFSQQKVMVKSKQNVRQEG
ncbi:hypothetical protein M0802_016924 [Mischocyttarus mexicanus]|nr:hypothetical protein M0802_016924 [Mischocyttarus mexicanus]